MGRLIYSMSVSLDGFVETPTRSLDWSALYADGTDLAGRPKRGGGWGFAVLAGGVGTPTGFRVIHARAVPDDKFQSWLDFFRSIPGRPSAVLADRWPDLIKAAGVVWPGITVNASTWHTYDLLRRRFNKARMYPGTHELVGDAEAAFSDPDLFRAWRKRAEIEAPRSVKAFLAAEGDAIQKRLDGPGPYATGTGATYDPTWIITSRVRRPAT